ncbi:hypothetical protein MKX07_002689 [Trichoderma sp. CBMAI-0711]|uniref:Uncharacterized protein n=1 Tax=Trichoderma parareesei TaxID=858221 RepID=A0A2H2ZYZ9_TRIPA|nr:hypothetical protein MKX07_002689 [Trichoderma sp. CBMAI-0711]OTA05745.1 hypothetical protein A9Z42_0064430 [Trichoderma parareesei]
MVQHPSIEGQAGPSGQRTVSMPNVHPGSSPHHRRYDETTESWVEVASQPSSSSLSSIGDEIVTTGLRVGGSSYSRRRRVQAPARSVPRVQTTIPVTGTSSQDEYDESDSEEDHVLSSSTENMQPSPEEDMEDSNGDSDGDEGTALGGARNQPAFRPQPNAFSHPPLHPRSYSSNAAMSSHPHGEFTRPSFSQRSHTRVQRGPSFMSPSVREDNDAALRASLTTLLSCAAAARGLPKSKEEAEAQRAAQTGVGPSSQPMELRFVPETELEEECEKPQSAAAAAAVTPPAKGQPSSSPARSSSRTRSPSAKGKRVVSTARSPRAAKKKRTGTTAVVAEEALISPTLLTWVVSAGVVVLVSVVGFGAGYVIGREVGRQEGLAAGVTSVNDTASSGRDVIRSSGGGLRRFRWGAVGRSIVAQA